MNIHVAQTVRESEAKRIAESLIPELQKRAALAEELRRVPDESSALLKSSGLLRTIQPASCGGDQLSMRAHVDVVSSVARGCNATGWVLGVYQAHSWMFGHMSEQAQNDVFADDADQAVAAVIGPRGKATRKADGSYILSGFWPFASGNAASEWLLLGSEIFD